MVTEDNVYQDLLLVTAVHKWRLNRKSAADGADNEAVSQVLVCLAALQVRLLMENFLLSLFSFRNLRFFVLDC
jgi:hypothetical protein